GSVVLTSTDEVRSVVVFDQLPDLKLPVKFKYIITEGDHTTQTYRVIFSLPKTDQANILPGMSVTIIPDAEAPVENKQRSILIPLKSIISDNSGNKFSWKVAVDGTVTRTKIETGALIGDKVRIVSGLTRGDQIVTTGVNSLRDGMKVRPLGLE
nr:hypothetical protein [Endozoicomonas sp.]